MYKIIAKSKIWFAISIISSLISIAAIMFFGLRWGIDYRGGTVLEFQTVSSDRLTTTKSILDELNYRGYQTKEGAGNKVVVRLETLSNDQHRELAAKLSGKMPDYAETQYDTVGPTISNELRNKSILAVVLASLAIIIYVAYAFRKVPRPLSSWKFGVCAVVALIHDLLITTGFVAIMGHFLPWMEVDALFITALLTIMGFSVHDTIVVYDRLRENFIRNPHQDFELSAEESVNQTLVRSINTSMTTIIVLSALLVFGSMSIKYFVTVLVFGIAIGTYSSIFTAIPLLIYWQKRSMKSPGKS